MKKKLLIIIIIVVVLGIAGTLAFLILTGRLFGSKDAASSDVSSVAASSVSAAPDSAVSASGSDASASVAAPAESGNPSLFFEGTFYFQNLTGSALSEIRLSPSGSNAWEDNILGSTALNNGETWEQSLMLRDLSGTWDLRAKDASGQELSFTGLDMRANTKFVLTMENGAPSLRQAA